VAENKYKTKAEEKAEAEKKPKEKTKERREYRLCVFEWISSQPSPLSQPDFLRRKRSTLKESNSHSLKLHCLYTTPYLSLVYMRFKQTPWLVV